MNPKTAQTFLVALALLGAFRVPAQSLAIDWHKIAGSGASSSAQYTVSGTIGQHDAGVAMSSTNFSVTGGFWSLVALQTPAAPSLHIRLTSTNRVMIFWPSTATAFVLQQNGDLSTTNWVAPVETISDDNTNKFIIVDPPAGNRFYRLSKP